VKNLSTNNFFLIAGPCVLESQSHAIFMAKEIKKICDSLEVDLIFKASWDKANRTKLKNYRGFGLAEAIVIFKAIKELTGVKIITDFHLPEQADKLKGAVDYLQVPAFLCRQTDMLVAAAKTGLPVCVKKGQFMSAEAMEAVVDKIRSSGGEEVYAVERGNIFGYNNLIVDMLNLPKMRKFVPVVFDASHTTQIGCVGGSSGAYPEYTPYLAKAAVAVGIDGLFLEVHDNPEKALCDGKSMLKLDKLQDLLVQLKGDNG